MRQNYLLLGGEKVYCFRGGFDFELSPVVVLYLFCILKVFGEI